MRQLMTLVLVALLNVGCATVSYSTETDDFDISYTGTSGGAKDLIKATAEANRRQAESKATMVLASKAVEKKMPVSVNSSERKMNMTAGGYYGYGFGQGWQGSYPVSSAARASEMATFGRFSPTGGMRNYGRVDPYQSVIQVCPRNRSPVTLSEQAACNKQNLQVLMRRLYKPRRRR
jgi:hypothetical protein